jgi:hypothetical protein
MQNPTQALNSVKGPGNIFDLNLFADSIPFPYDIPWWDSASQAHSRVSNINFDIWVLVTPCCELEVQNHTQALKSVKVPGYTFDLDPKL